MFFSTARQRSLFVYHLHMGGPDAAAVEWTALRSPRFEARVRHAGVTHVDSAAEADVVIVTGVLTQRNLDAVLAQIASMPSPSILIAAGDSAIIGLPNSFPISHYADVHISIPGNPPSPQALIAALPAAAKILAHPSQRLEPPTASE